MTETPGERQAARAEYARMWQNVTADNCETARIPPGASEEVERRDCSLPDNLSDELINHILKQDVTSQDQ